MKYKQNLTKNEVLELEDYISSYSNYELMVSDNQTSQTKILSKPNILKYLENITNLDLKTITITGCKFIDSKVQKSEWKSTIEPNRKLSNIERLKSLIKL